MNVKNKLEFCIVLHHLLVKCMNFPLTYWMTRTIKIDFGLLEFTGIVPPVILLMSQLVVFS